MSDIKSIIAIPARLDSIRLPNKILKKIGSETMIERVLNQCKAAKGPSDVYLCTDSNKLKEFIENKGFKVLLTPNSCQSGSERISTVADKLIKAAWSINMNNEISNQILEEKEKNTLIINVQGDQPFINPNIIEKTHNLFLKEKNFFQVATPIYKLKQQNIHSPNIVKVILNHKNQAVYFSRAAIPYIRDVKHEEWANHHDYWGHIGIYGFRGDLIRKWNNIKISKHEKMEKLEQLRLIDAGIAISCIKVNDPILSIDTQNDLEEARKLLNLKS